MPTGKALLKDAYLTFRADDMQASFKNGVIINGELATLLPNASYLDEKFVTLPKNLLKPGENKILITAGNSVSPMGTDGNNDDFRIQNIRIGLGDGSMQAIASIRGKKLNVNEFVTITDPEARQSVGDGTNYLEYLELTINIPDNALFAVGGMLDTKSLPDGEHAFVLANGTDSASLSATVDNTLPEFESFSIEEGKSYYGKIDFNGVPKDVTSGIASVTATLDGNPLSLPASRLASELAIGDHVFEVKALDNAGNEAVSKATFHVANDKPNPPTEPKPAMDTANVGRNASLSVKVSDPNGEPMNVTFGQAYRYDFNENSDIDAFSNAVDREPPLVLNPDGETPFANEAISNVSKKDGSYYVTDAEGLFPYQRFDFKLNQDIDAIAEVEVVWEGHSLPDRKVTMYTWNNNTGKWVAATSGMGAEDFQLKAKVSAADMVKNKTIHVLIQDLVPTSPDGVDFSFAWASDTQYYADSYPEIFDREMKYIADHKEDKKVAYAIHTGDLVDDFNRADEWAVASKSMKYLEDAGIPYGVVTGNHDVNHDEGNYEEYYKYFGRDRFEDQPTYGDDLNNNRDHYDLVSVKGQDFLIM